MNLGWIEIKWTGPGSAALRKRELHAHLETIYLHEGLIPAIKFYRHATQLPDGSYICLKESKEYVEKVVGRIYGGRTE